MDCAYISRLKTGTLAPVWNF